MIYHFDFIHVHVHTRTLGTEIEFLYEITFRTGSYDERPNN